jgi:predicted RNA-binding protein YlqC (UPF0109 family)|tara:strand:- start:111 stop:368 length:258 start_codon:yes stop_codon:yes gene_type:complete
MSAEELVGFLVRGLVDNPDDVDVQPLEGDASLVLEVSVNADDVELVKGDDGETMRHLKAVVSAAAGKRKTIVELVATHGEAEEEE